MRNASPFCPGTGALPRVWGIHDRVPNRGPSDHPASGSESSAQRAHLLRHSLATTLLQRGASLQEIGDVLRHRQSDTTQIYAKVDIATLQGLVQPWPEEVS